MKKTASLFFVVLLFSCTQQSTTQPNAVANTNTTTAQPYKPGLGEIMSVIQMHHAKLWFAGINENWKLADYEIKEIKENFQTAKDFETDRKETGDLPMIDGSIDSVLAAVQQKNLPSFKNSFQSLTNTCNSCHRSVNFEFNVVTIPTAPPVSNQEFKLK